MRSGVLLVLLIISCTSAGSKSVQISEPDDTTTVEDTVITLISFYSENAFLEAKVDSIFASIDDHSRVAQLLMPAVGPYGQEPEVIRMLIEEKKIGGVLMLNGSKEEFTGLINEFNSKNRELNSLPFLYSADAEPSLVNRKISGSTPVKKANQLSSEDEVTMVAQTISQDLLDIGINYNFSPVVDMSPNKTVGYRGFGSNPENIVPFSNAFINATQEMNIIATAKHFPGHGLVSGDTHKALQVINGSLKELSNYPPIIDNGVLSIMVAHIAVKNNPEFNTQGMPATTSRKIVHDLLRDSLGFGGLIVTDAMNMGGVAKVKNAEVLAIEAGCDIILMPLNAAAAHEKLLKRYKEDTAFRDTVDEAVKRIIRMKVCLGLL